MLSSVSFDAFDNLIMLLMIFLDALLNPSTALDATVQDFLDSFQESSDAAFADLVNCVFRACGCNSSVNSDEVVDSDGVVEFLNDLIEEIKSVCLIFFSLGDQALNSASTYSD